MNLSVLGLFLLLPVYLIIYSQPASAQIVNVAQLVDQEVREGFSLSTELSWERRLGNSDLSTLAGKATTYFRHSDHLLILILDREYGIQNQETFIDRSFQHLRYRYQFSDWVEVESFIQHDRNRFRRLASRSLIGAGPRFALVQTDQHLLYLGIAPMYESEEFETDSFVSDAPLVRRTENNVRISSSLSYRFQLADHVIFGNTAYWQPIIDEQDRYRLLNDTSLTLHITKRLGLGFSATLTHDTDPPAGVRRTDHHYKNSLIINF